tara:strand:- start:46590 stop:46820 length:231 start_codon:yes stop_codon:yes gene_type:complete
MKLKNIVREWITTLVGLFLLVVTGIHLYHVAVNEVDLEGWFSFGGLVAGLFLITSTDRMIKITLNKIVGVKFLKNE